MIAALGNLRQENVEVEAIGRPIQQDDVSKKKKKESKGIIRLGVVIEAT